MTRTQWNSESRCSFGVLVYQVLLNRRSRKWLSSSRDKTRDGVCLLCAAEFLRSRADFSNGWSIHLLLRNPTRLSKWVIQFPNGSGPLLIHPLSPASPEDIYPVLHSLCASYPKELELQARCDRHDTLCSTYVSSVNQLDHTALKGRRHHFLL